MDPSIGFWVGHGEQPGSGTSRRREAQELLQIGPNTDRAQKVQKRHRTIRGIVPLQTSVTHLHHQPEGLKR